MKALPFTPLLAAAFLVTASLRAQTAAPASPTAGASTTSAETAVELSPFVVNAAADVGYVATNTMSGSRLNTPLKDTAASISVMTEEFLSDIAATSVDEALKWANNVQEEFADDPGGSTDNNPNGFFGTSNSFRVRGARASLTRNYFEWNLPRDTYNVERIEESRGPNSVLFGIGSAGGIINSSTKQAVPGRSFLRAGATVSSFNGHRGTLDANRAVLNGKLGLRVNAVYDEGDGYLTHSGGTKRALHVAVKYQLKPDTQFRAEFETGDAREILAAYPLSGESVLTWMNTGRTTVASPVAANAALGISRYGTNVTSNAHVAYIGNNGRVINLAGQNFGGASSRTIFDPAVADLNINGGGPGQLRNSYYDAFSAFLNHRLGTNTHVELGYNRQHTNSVAYQAFGDSGSLSFDPNLTLPGNTPNPYGGRLMFDGTTVRRLNDAKSDNGRIMLSTELDLGKWGHYRLAGMGEYEQRLARFGPQLEVWAGRPFNPNPENAVNNVYRRSYIENEGAWDTYYRNMPAQTGLIQNAVDPVTGRTLSSTWVAQNQGQQADPAHQTTTLLGLQARYFKNRLVLGLGFRQDRLNVDDRGARRNPVTNEFEVDYDNVTQLNYKGRTSTLGAVYHVAPWVSLLYNRADNFSLPNLGLRMLPDSLPGGNPKGEGEDIGLNFTLLDGKLHARAVYYQSGTLRAQGQHGFGSTNTSPTPLTTRIVDGLVAAGLISSAEGDAHRSTANAILFDTTSEGYEFSLTANPTRNWRLQANYSTTTNFEENIGTELQTWAVGELAYFKRFPQTTPVSGGTVGSVIALFEDNMETQFAVEGEELRSNRKHKTSFVARYSFSNGMLKGLFVGGGYRFQSKNIGGRTPLPERRAIMGRAISTADAFAGYTVRQVPLVGQVRFQLNVSNLFDNDKPLETLFFDDGSVRRVVRVAPRMWRLSANVDF